MPGRPIGAFMLKLLTATFLSILLSGCGRELSRTEFLLGTVCTIRIWGGNEADLDAAFDRIREIEELMSRHIPGSDVNRISTGGPGGTLVDTSTCTVIRRALDFGRLSGGLFDITLAPVVDLWGFGTDRAAVPAAETLEAALPLVDYRRIEVRDGCTVVTGEGQGIDLGGIAKGYASHECARVLAERGVDRALVNLGGNVFALGEKKDGSPWTIGIQDPLEPTGSSLGILEISGGAVVTSGIYERFFEEDGKRYHHILDPGTGYPVDNNLSGVSVSIASGLDADALSTSLFLLGIERGCDLLRSFPGSGAVFVTKDREVVTFGSASTAFRLINQDYTVTERLQP